MIYAPNPQKTQKHTITRLIQGKTVRNVRYNPVIVKYPFWQMTNDNPKAVYACLNYNEAYCPKQIESQSICIDGDSQDVIARLL
ncbi:MAG: hypothetical protein II419_08705 [Acidaminococcaceae bacterium]|nr:hypothetical protein [Acidaminococcaceae bacterium]